MQLQEYFEILLRQNLALAQKTFWLCFLGLLVANPVLAAMRFSRPRLGRILRRLSLGATSLLILWLVATLAGAFLRIIVGIPPWAASASGWMGRITLGDLGCGAD